MFTTGSKFLIGATVAAILAALAYGLTQDGVMGTIGLISAAVALGFLAGVNIYTRDANVFVTDDLVVERTAAAQLAPRSSGWPIVFAVGALVLVVGLVTYQALVIIGFVLLFVAGAEWTAQAWAERASASAVHNAEVRSRITNPFEFPVGGALVIGVVVYSFSRIMLWLSKTNTVIAFVVMAAAVLTVAGLLGTRRSIHKGTIAGGITIAALALVAGGVASGLDGERETHPHETTGGESTEGICENPEETEADEKASQRVAASASVAAVITLDEDATLSYELNGPPPAGQEAVLSLPRSNPNTILFSNQSEEDRRLSLDLGTKVVTGEDGEDEDVINQACTTLVEPDGEQLITVTIDQPSVSFPDGFRIFVPGVDGAELELYVP